VARDTADVFFIPHAEEETGTDDFDHGDVLTCLRKGTGLRAGGLTLQRRAPGPACPSRRWWARCRRHRLGRPRKNHRGTHPVPVAEGNMLRLLRLARHDKLSVGPAVLALAQGDGRALSCDFVLRHVEGEGWREDIERARAIAQTRAHEEAAPAIAQAMSGAGVVHHSTNEATFTVTSADFADGPAAAAELFT
jgi:hypothetical protein